MRVTVLTTMPGPSSEGDLPGIVNSLTLDSKKRAAGAEPNKGHKKKRYSPDAELRFSLDTSSKLGDVSAALEVYDRTRKSGSPKLNQYHYNVLLYLCSSAALGVLVPVESREQQKSEEKVGIRDGDIVFRGHMSALVQKRVSEAATMQRAQLRGLEIYEQMKVDKVVPNEATFTSVARLAVAKRDGDLAFRFVKEMIEAGVAPRLRSYGPALFTYFKNKQVDKAFEVDAHMVAAGIEPEEMELEMLLELCSGAGLEEKVYWILHRLRRSVTSVSSSTADTIKRWFTSEAASSISSRDLAEEAVKAALESRGGGGHELGWMGAGTWRATYSVMDQSGICSVCQAQMATVDLRPDETDRFAAALAALAFEKERDSNSFKEFQNWLQEHGPFDAIVDGANVALYNQNFAAGGFSFAQLSTVVSELQKIHGKRPLVVLHKRRVTGGPASSHEAGDLIKEWTEANALYTTPTGSNDDWYWLYAAVKLKCLLISNDEMRDHLFQLLGNEFFPRWKERHQVHFDFSTRGLSLSMPPPYSVLIQESGNGSWHVPIAAVEDNSPRSWLCVTR